MKPIRIARARLAHQRLVCGKSTSMIADEMAVDLIPSAGLVLITAKNGDQAIMSVAEFATLEPATTIRPEDLGADPRGPGRPRTIKTPAAPPKPKKPKKKKPAPPKKLESRPRLPKGPKVTASK